MSFSRIIEKYRVDAFSERNKGDRFERLIQKYLLTDPLFANQLDKVWLWNDFPLKEKISKTDVGIDLVGFTKTGEYWAIQCKFYAKDSYIDKPQLDTFLSTSGRKFKDENGNEVSFSQRYWISTSSRWSDNAENVIKNQHPPFNRISLDELANAPVDWDKIEDGDSGAKALNNTRNPLPHQAEAINKAITHFQENDRGKLIMACGTGKTYTSLKLAEKLTNGSGMVLFLVPSIALLGQTLREWTAFSEYNINAICICSDPEISKRKSKNDDTDTMSVVDLYSPASTNVSDIVNQFRLIKNRKLTGMTVVFSTYQSINVIAETQSKIMKEGFSEFDLIICDEAHRTTGVSLAGEDESAFTKVHNNDFLKSQTRLYMTATPRLYDDVSKSKAAQAEAILCSMDDEAMYGKEIYRIGFGEAVEKDLLSDYKVIILTLSDKHVPSAIQKMMSDGTTEVKTDELTKLIGTITSLSKQFIGADEIDKIPDPNPMQRAVAFCSTINNSKAITSTFNQISETYIRESNTLVRDKIVKVESLHIDGTMTAPTRDELLSWLKTPAEDGNCKVLTNVRCLSEGVDVPSLDAVIFLSPKNSQIDVVQSVGRVMRKSPGKNYGYIIIPVVIPSNVTPEEALNDNERYKVVWTVLNALRAHDDRFNAIVHRIEMNNRKPDNIEIVEPNQSFTEDMAITEYADTANAQKQQLTMQFQELQGLIFAKLVQRVGERGYWEQWAKEVAQIAERQIERIKYLVENFEEQKLQFQKFIDGLRKNINPSISEHQAIEMLAQHIITKPIFESLFEGYSFVSNNAVSVSMQAMLDILESNEKDFEVLNKFYESVRSKISKIDNAEGKQKIIIQIYDKFFKTAFPKMVEQLGIVYTPVEVVDFIIHSVSDILKKEFDRNISDENIHILDPFTGTGTFITRLLQSGLIDKKDLLRKYQHEIHANEIVLLAYYIAAVNIENTFHDIYSDSEQNGNDKTEYIPFDGVVLTDTFQLSESDENGKYYSEMFPKNSDRVDKQKKAPLRIIFGNPPYSIGQKSANDNAQNQTYPLLDKRIANTYAKQSNAGLNKSLYDAYIKAFRWSTDRLDKTGGIICFVSNGAWLDGNSTDGFRKSLEQEFDSIYVFNLRGNQRTSGELSRKEGGKIFGSGSRTPIAITLLVKNSDSKKELGLNNAKAKIHYYDIGDYLNREEKLHIISKFKSFANNAMPLQELTPNEQGDWISKRNTAFESYIPIEPEKKFDNVSKTIFTAISLGLGTNRDSFIYNSSFQKLQVNIEMSINFYNFQRISFHKELILNPKINAEKFISFDSSKLNWTDSVVRDLTKNVEYKFDDSCITDAIYRPYFKQKVYFKKELNHRTYQQLKLFPNKNSNLVISTTGSGGNKGFSCLISKYIMDLNCLEAGTQCYPLYYYEENTSDQLNFYKEGEGKDYVRKEAISDYILGLAKKQYGTNAISKEDIFYYVYGFLHSQDYREKFANDLKKMLPRLPLVEDVKDFWAFSKAGRQLADLHLNYETIPAYPQAIVTGETKGNFHVDKMRYPKKGQTDTIIYNHDIKIENIPDKAYQYIVNGRSAIDWILERYQITTHKESGIKNDPNDWAKEVGNPRYILDLLLSIINVSVQTVDIVNSLPKLTFEEEKEEE